MVTAATLISAEVQNSKLDKNGVPGSGGATAVPAQDFESIKLDCLKTISLISKPDASVISLLLQLNQGLKEIGVKTLAPVDAEPALERLKTALKERGTHGIISLGKKFKSMDDDNDKKLSFMEFRKALLEMSLSESDLHKLFRYFDSDCNGYLSYDELLVGLRGALNPRRLDMVQRAFKVLDKTGDGAVTMDDLRERYDASKHPDVLLGTKSPEQVLGEFLSTFEGQGAGVAGDGKVSCEEFTKYYQAVSASIDHDDMFELVIRNAWHISGGEGWYANTTCKRVLVLHEDGRQTVQEIQNDFDIQPEQYLAVLKEQGVTDAKSVALYGEPSDISPSSNKPLPGTPQALPPSPAGATGRFAAQGNRKGGADHFRSTIVLG